MPANTPGPMIVTSINAQINELIERDDTMMNSAAGRMNARGGGVWPRAKEATGTAMIIPIAVPSVAMLMVSHIGRHNWWMKPQSGGTMRTARSAACVGASATKAQIVLSEINSQQ